LVGFASYAGLPSHPFTHAAGAAILEATPPVIVTLAVMAMGTVMATAMGTATAMAMAMGTAIPMPAHPPSSLRRILAVD
jgi:hypothetical protein